MSTPANFNIQFLAGDSYELFVQWTDANNVPIDLTSTTLDAEIRTLSIDTVVLDTFTIAVTDAPNGRFTMSLSPAQTQDLLPLTDNPLKPSGSFVYDVQSTDSGVVETFLSGSIAVTQSVTRP